MRTTTFDFENPDAVFKVLVNHEEQYSLWPADLPIPGGWTETMQGSKDECDEYVRQVWTDMRPKSLREAMERDAKAREQGQEQDQGQDSEQEPEEARQEPQD